MEGIPIVNGQHVGVVVACRMPISHRDEPLAFPIIARKEAVMDQRPPRILIADDNPQGVELLEAYLAGADYELAVATDGEDTLAKVASFQPDLILLDVMMPKISGFEVCKRLRRDPATSDVAILMVTALDQNSDIDRAVDA